MAAFRRVYDCHLTAKRPGSAPSPSAFVDRVCDYFTLLKTCRQQIPSVAYYNTVGSRYLFDVPCLSLSSAQLSVLGALRADLIEFNTSRVLATNPLIFHRVDEHHRTPIVRRFGAYSLAWSVTIRFLVPRSETMKKNGRLFACRPWRLLAT